MVVLKLPNWVSFGVNYTRFEEFFHFAESGLRIFYA